MKVDIIAGVQEELLARADERKSEKFNETC